MLHHDAKLLLLAPMDAVEVDAQHSLPVRLIQLVYLRRLSDDTGIVDGNV